MAQNNANPNDIADYAASDIVGLRTQIAANAVFVFPSAVRTTNFLRLMGNGQQYYRPPEAFTVVLTGEDDPAQQGYQQIPRAYRAHLIIIAMGCALATGAAQTTPVTALESLLNVMTRALELRNPPTFRQMNFADADNIGGGYVDMTWLN